MSGWAVLGGDLLAADPAADAQNDLGAGVDLRTGVAHREGARQKRSSGLNALPPSVEGHHLAYRLGAVDAPQNCLGAMLMKHCLVSVQGAVAIGIQKGEPPGFLAPVGAGVA